MNMCATESDTPADWLPVVSYQNAAVGGNNALQLGSEPSQPDPKAPWEKCCAAFVIIDGVAQALSTLILQGKLPINKPNLKNDIVAALYGLNQGLHDVSVAFKAYIDKNTPFTIEPPVVDTWPDPNAKAPADLGYFDAAFNAIAGTLSLLSKSIQDKLAGNPDAQAAFDALTALVNGKDAILQKVRDVLTQLEQH